MSLELWKQNGWLREHRASAQEVASIIALIERDLTDADVESWLQEKHPEIHYRQ